jgi:ATP-dependent protease ClpP protease subunit
MVSEISSQVLCDSKKRSIHLKGPIISLTPYHIKRAVRKLTKHDANTPIHLLISSSGGDFYASLHIFQYIKRCSTPIYTIVVEKAVSGALLILQGGKKRYARQGATLGFHNVIHRLRADDVYNSTRYRQQLEELCRIDAIQCLILTKHGRPVNEILKLFGEEARISAKCAKQLHLIDDIITKPRLKK